MADFSISFIIPKRPNEKIEKIIELVANSCQKNGVLFEIIVSEGNHPTYQRCDCIKLARFDYVYFIDNDSEVNTQSIKILMDFIDEKQKSSIEIDAIGGPTLLIKKATPIMRAINTVLTHRLAVGKVAARYSSIGEVRESNEAELILCNLVMRRLIFDELKGFEKKLYPGEEVDFIMRLLRRKKKVFYHPQITVHRPQRESLAKFIYQMYRYGMGRAELTRINIKNFSFLFLLPAFLLMLFIFSGIGIFTLYGMAVLIKYLMIFPTIYFAYSGIILWSTMKKKQFSWQIFPCIVSCHLFFAIGILKGIFHWRFSSDKKKISYKVAKISTKKAKSAEEIKKVLTKLKSKNN